MTKNFYIWLGLLAASFVFSLFYFKWFSWILLLIVAAVPVVSLALSLPFMIFAAVRGLHVSAPESAVQGDCVQLGVSPKRGAAVYPRLRLKLAYENRFASRKGSFCFYHSGVLRAPALCPLPAPAAHCGVTALRARSCRVYDMLGIFFLPVRTTVTGAVTVYPRPQKPALQPDEGLTVVGYRPKSGGGFSDDYELRPYQDGDSPRQIHWKLSARTDDTIVREPSLPVYRELPFIPVFSRSCMENDGVLGRFWYAVARMLRRGSVTCADGGGKPCRVESEEDLARFVRGLYAQAPEASMPPHGAAYCVLPDGEEVSGT